MIALAKWIAFAFAKYGGGILLQVAATLGIAFVFGADLNPASGFNLNIQAGMDLAFAGIPAPYAGYIGVMRLDDAVKLCLSASLVRFVAANVSKLQIRRAAATIPNGGL